MKNIILIFCLFSSSLTAKIYDEETATKKYLTQIEISNTSSGLEGVDCIYVINLDKRPERWAKTQNQLQKYGFFGNRISAINGWELPAIAFRETAGTYPIRLTGGQLGCCLSHLSVLQDAINRGFKVIWILEDDCEFVNNPKYLSNVLDDLSKLDPSWDILYTDTDARDGNGNIVVSVGHDFRPDRDNMPLSFYLQRTIINSDLMKIGQRFGTHSLFFSRAGMQKVLHYFTHVNLWTPYDIDLHYIPNIREYSTLEDFVISWTITSDTFHNKK